MRVGRETQPNKNHFCCSYYSSWISFMEIWPLASDSNNILWEESMIHWNGALQYLWKGKLGRTQEKLSCGKPIQGTTATQRSSTHSKKQQKGTKHFQGNDWMWWWSQGRNYYWIRKGSYSTCGRRISCPLEINGIFLLASMWWSGLARVPVKLKFNWKSNKRSQEEGDV